jgi:putative membrane-bound dehydrogenase-like protein
MVLAWIGMLLPAGASFGQITDLGSNGNALPTVPPGFEVKLFAKEPLVRQPCSMAFDAKGRLFIGMGPQYRKPTPNTPGDSVVMVEDTDGDGVADKVKVFATGFNCIQGLAWHGKDLWVANVPDLTIVRDLDGDDEADEYVRVYTDLGNLEHGLHGLNWAPDGKLYMSKGNSKGLTRPDRIAPKPFRDLWGVKAPANAPDFPPAITFRKGEYRHAYHDPADDWGREGGILRCDDGGKNLEIVSRGMRNPWDITLDDGFNWLGTDNDQREGDRVFMPFWNAHFGWNHSWSSHWTDKPHPTCAPVSGPMFDGSGTGIIYCDSPQFPPEYRRVFFINDWLRKTTFAWKPTWEGALLKPESGTWKPFIEGGNSLFRPTDLEVGPDGALWVLGWSRYYGAEPASAYKDGQMINEGRIFHIRWKDAKPRHGLAGKRQQPIEKWSVPELIEDFEGPLPVWRINAADELVRRGRTVKADLIASLQSGKLSTLQETWTAWTLGRILPEDAGIEEFFTARLKPDSPTSINLRIQAIRILAYRIRQYQMVTALPPAIGSLLMSVEPRLRFACIDAIAQARQTAYASALVDQLATETDRVVYYAGWQALRELQSPEQLKRLLSHPRSLVRRASLLGLLESNSLADQETTVLTNDSMPEVREIATLRMSLLSRSETTIAMAPEGASLIAELKVRSKGVYRPVPGGAVPGVKIYTDRDYLLKQLPQAMHGMELLQTANKDDNSRGDSFLTFEALAPLRVHVGLDARQKQPPKWLTDHFRRSDARAEADHWNVHFYTKDYPAGRVELGGNTDFPQSGSKSHYFVLIESLPLPQLALPTTLAQGLEHLPKANARRGEAYFHQVAGCAKCHSLTQQKNSFGPQLSDIGARAEPRHIVQSIVEPDAHITEGFSQLRIETKDGKVHTGVLMAESGLNVTLGLPSLQQVVIPKEDIETRTTTGKSAMPSFDRQLSPSQVADIAAFLITRRAKPSEVLKPVSGTPMPKKIEPVAANPTTGKPDVQNIEPAAIKPVIDSKSKFGLDIHKDRLAMTFSGKALGEYVWGDPKILRPYFANLHGLAGTKITRNHPPVAGKDATDHESMHPGLWLAFGDISGVDFWRNRGRIQHRKFLSPPSATEDRIDFATESDLLKPDGVPMGGMVNRYTLTRRPSGWLIVWDSTFIAREQDLVFGDQEEMGLGARVASELTEKNGGTLISSSGAKSAKATWGKTAAWCDYSGTKDAQPLGITLMPGTMNFRESWWHNRDYGVFVANPFGREAMKQGARSAVSVKKGDSLRLVFGAMLHDGRNYDPTAEYHSFREAVKSIRE